VNGSQLSFMVDTGANVVALSGVDADRLGIDYRGRGERTSVLTAAGPSAAWAMSLDRVEVSGILVRNVRATVIEGPHPEPALLGMSWLQRVGLREESGVMYLRER
jgi:aspartyl protease family protein